MEVSPETATASAEFDGATYSFCAQSCKDAFLAEPHRYLDGEVGKKGGTGLAQPASASPLSAGARTRPAGASAEPGMVISRVQRSGTRRACLRRT